tara:strand:+ start:194 stop:1879 length:1686 start_codon:yes stop_codon:yes gene_type:complete
MFLSALADLFSIGAAFIFLTALNSDQNNHKNNSLVLNIANFFGTDNLSNALVPITLIFATSIFFVGLIRIYNLWLSTRVCSEIGNDLSCLAYEKVLFQDYLYHTKTNTSRLIVGINNNSNVSVICINQLVNLITSAFSIIFIVIGLITLSPMTAFSSITIFTASYFILANKVKRKLYVNSKHRNEVNPKIIRNVQEGLGAIREVILSGLQKVYVKEHRRLDYRLKTITAENKFLSSFTRYAFEAIGLLAVSFLVLIINGRGSNSQSLLPILGTIALASQRILPSFQQIYLAWAMIKSSEEELNYLLSLVESDIENIDHKKPKATLGFKNEIKLENISFAYTKDNKNVINDLSLTIKRGNRIAIIGETGDGKSTLLDIIMGLVKPNRGELLVDGQDIFSNKDPKRLKEWQKNIAHVPQTIYLADCSITENIAFGIPKKMIDHKRVKYAAEKARILNFISQMPNKFETIAGERGVSLSGGQRQRIGIARAIYKSANVLIFDEATSALDYKTEDLLIDTIKTLPNNLTLIMVAHRLRTISFCDRIIKIKEGTIVADGPPNEIIK